MCDESLRWLIANNKIKEAKKVIKNACKWNRKDYKTVMDEIGWDVNIDETDATNMDAKILNSLNESQNSIPTKEVKVNDVSRQDSGMDNLTIGQENIDCVNESEDLIENKQKPELDKKESKVVKYTVIDLFRHKRILIVSAILWYTW